MQNQPSGPKGAASMHFTVNWAISNQTPAPEGGTCQNFDRDARPIFLGLKFGQIQFFCVGKFFLLFFLGYTKFPLIVLGLTNFQLFFWVFQFLYHTLESFE